MRTSRAYIAGLGTSTVLIGSTFLLFMVVTALVAFKTWPDSGISDAVSGLIVDDQAPSLAVSGPVQVALDAAPAAAAVGAAPVPVAPGRVPGGGQVLGTEAASAPTAPAETGGSGELTPRSISGDGRTTQPGAVAPPSARPGAGPTGRPLDNAPVNGLGGVTKGLGDTTEGLTNSLGQTVGGVNPQLGKGVTDTGEALADLVRGLGGK